MACSIPLQFCSVQHHMPSAWLAVRPSPHPTKWPLLPVTYLCHPLRGHLGPYSLRNTMCPGWLHSLSIMTHQVFFNFFTILAALVRCNGDPRKGAKGRGNGRTSMGRGRVGASAARHATSRAAMVAGSKGSAHCSAVCLPGSLSLSLFTQSMLCMLQCLLTHCSVYFLGT